MTLPTISATLDDSPRVSSIIVVQPGVVLQATADTDDLDDGTLLLEVSQNSTVGPWLTVRDVNGAEVKIVGAGSTQALDVLIKNDSRGPMYFRWRIEPIGAEDPIVGEAAITLLSPYVAALDLSYLPAYADNAAALAAGEAIGAAYAVSTTGAIMRVIAA
jgi:hypothetical protein